jgi:hypothetical protein
MPPTVCDAHDHGSEVEWRACPVCHQQAETPSEVVCALIEAYRQAGQDAIHASWGESWPTHKEREAAELNAPHGRCAAWLGRFEAAVERVRDPSVPVAALRALLAELDGWPERPTNYGDACDRLSALIAAHGGEGPDDEADIARAERAWDAWRNW